MMMYELTKKDIIVVCSPDTGSILYGNKNTKECLYQGSINPSKAKENHDTFLHALSLREKTKVLNLYPFLPKDIPCEAKTNLVFVRDVFVHTPSGVWIGKMKETARAHETRMVRDIFEKLGIPIVGESTEGFLEGGDVFFCSEKLCLIGVGTRTNKAGALEFIRKNNLMCERYALVSPILYDIEMSRIHLDCIFGMVDDTKVLLWRDIIHQREAPYSRMITEYKKDSNGNLVKTEDYIPFYDYLLQKGFEVVPISNMSQRNYGCNVLHLGDGDVLVQDKESYEAIPNSHPIQFDEIHKMYGGLRCATNWL